MTVPVATSPGSAVRRVGGVPFQVTSLSQAVDWALALTTGPPTAAPVRFLNAWCLAVAHRDDDYHRLLTSRGVNFPDGTPIVWFLRRGGPHRAARVRGPSFFAEMMHRGVAVNVRHFLLGGSPEVLDELARSLTGRYDGIRIVGRYAPPYAPPTSDFITDCVDRIRPVRPDCVWVGLGTPKQDVVGAQLSETLGVPVFGVGAAFDFAAGATREAPVWVQRSGFEWLFRLATEPRRLWRRYLVGNVTFLIAVARRWRSDRE